MILIRAFTSILLLLPIPIIAQIDSLYSGYHLKEDFRIYRQALEEAHPGLYWYRTKSEMDSIFEAAYTTIGNSVTERDFFSLLSSVTAKIGCLHTYVMASESFTEENINAEARPLPFEIKLDQNRMFVYQNLSNDKSISVGAEIVSVNNTSVANLMDYLVDKIPNDGYGKEWSRYALERSFRYYYYIFYGGHETYNLTIRDLDNSEFSVIVPGRLEKERTAIQQDRYGTSIDPVISLSFNDKMETAILRITRFGNWSENGKKYKFRKVLRQKLKELLDSNVSHLVLDVGDRGGGNELWGLELLSYFIDEPFTGYQAIEFKTLDYNIAKKYSNTSWFEYTLVKMLLNFEQSDSTYYLKNYKGLKPYLPKKQRFAGGIYLLVSGSTASATSDFAAWMDDLGLATIVGTETGGGYLGNTSNWEFIITLPNTHLRVHIPLARYLNNVKPAGTHGRGVIPDHIVPTPIEDKLSDKDTQLNYVLDIIGERKKKEL